MDNTKLDKMFNKWTVLNLIKIKEMDSTKLDKMLNKWTILNLIKVKKNGQY